MYFSLRNSLFIIFLQHDSIFKKLKNKTSLLCRSKDSVRPYNLIEISSLSKPFLEKLLLLVINI